MKVTFYGVRGSIATPGEDTVKYGGNTSCVLVEPDDKNVLIFDAGTGIRSLGQRLESDKRDISLIFSHHHWDHIQGLPFFKPLYQHERTMQIYNCHMSSNGTSVLDQMIDPHFPATDEELLASISDPSFDKQDGFRIGGVTGSTLPLNHPGGGYAFRLESGDGCLAYITDNELYPPGEPTTSYEAWCDFARNCDLLIHDAMYLDEELSQIHGWGHSLISQVLRLAADAKVKRVVLFHHDPSRTDAQLESILADSREWMAQNSPETEVFLAREGESFQLG